MGPLFFHIFGGPEAAASSAYAMSRLCVYIMSNVRYVSNIFPLRYSLISTNCTNFYPPNKTRLSSYPIGLGTGYYRLGWLLFCTPLVYIIFAMPWSNPKTIKRDHIIKFYGFMLETLFVTNNKLCQKKKKDLKLVLPWSIQSMIA